MFRPEARVGTVVKRYRLAQVLSSGGMGSLYRASHLKTGREVAIKFLLDLEDSARFLLEARATVELGHPHVVDVLDMDETEDGVPFLVMELLHGQTLGAAIAERGRFEPALVHEWLLPVMGAVAHAHGRGILHRDLKPDNIFLARGGDGRITPKLLDFGIAKSRAQPTITRSGAIVGTPAYMSPEQALAEQELTAASDVWSMGIVLYECCTGVRPYEGESATSVLLKVVRDPPPRLEAARPDLPAAWTRAVDRALQRSLDARPEDMADYAHRILMGALQAGLPVPDDPDPVGLPRWRAWRSGGGAMTLPDRAGPAAPRALHVPARPDAPTLDARAIPAQAPAPSSAGRSRRRVSGLVTALVVLSALGMGLWWWRASDVQAPVASEPPSAQVLRAPPSSTPAPAAALPPAASANGKDLPPTSRIDAAPLPVAPEPNLPEGVQPPASTPPPARADVKQRSGKRRDPASTGAAPAGAEPPAQAPADDALPSIESTWR